MYDLNYELFPSSAWTLGGLEFKPQISFSSLFQTVNKINLQNTTFDSCMIHIWTICIESEKALYNRVIITPFGMIITCI